MLNTVLVPVDGSAMSELAVPFAESLARAVGARIVFIRAVSSHFSLAPGADEYSESEAAQAQRALDEIARRVTNARLRAVSFTVHGDPAPSIVGAADAHQADIILMSTHGRGGMSRALYGSVADEVVRTTRIPVLLVPPGAKYRMTPPCKVLVALDGSKIAESAISPAVDLAEALRGRVVLVRATVPPTYWSADADGNRKPDSGSEAEAAREYLDAIAVQYERPTVEVSGYVTDEAPEEAILGAAQDYDAGVIAMATHGRSGLLRAVLGSVAQQVLHRTTLPVLLVHPSSLELRRTSQPMNDEDEAAESASSRSHVDGE